MRIEKIVHWVDTERLVQRVVANAVHIRFQTKFRWRQTFVWECTCHTSLSKQRSRIMKWLIKYVRLMLMPKIWACFPHTCFSYHKQAVADVEAVWRHTLQILRQLGRPVDSISEKDVKLFCRYASDIHVERGTSIADEYDPKTINANEIGNLLSTLIFKKTYQVFLLEPLQTLCEKTNLLLRCS